jgi:hypothetical protein
MRPGQFLVAFTLAFLLAGCGGAAAGEVAPSTIRAATASPTGTAALATPPLRLQTVVYEGKEIHFQSFVAENGRLCALTYGGLVFCRDSGGEFVGPLPLSSAADGGVDPNPPGLALLRLDAGRLCGLTYSGLLYCEE